jgi:prolipoprotein diacylglyceryltransferase
MNSEIYGVATNLPWGFIFDRNHETIAKHPTMIYEALCYLITFGVMMYFYYRKKDFKDKTGFLTGIFFMGVFFTRFMIEFVKEKQEAFEATMALDMGQWLSIPFIIAGIWLLYYSLTHPPVIYKSK